MKISPTVEQIRVGKDQKQSAVNRNAPQQDVIQVAELRTGNNLGFTLAVVADGENDSGSKLAAEVAVQTVFDKMRHAPESRIGWTLWSAVDEANRVIGQQKNAGVVAQDSYVSLTASIVFKKQLYVAHTGNTRLYLARENKDPVLLTTDYGSSDQSVRFLGIGYDVKIDLLTTSDGVDLRVNGGDQIVLCSDGLDGGNAKNGELVDKGKLNEMREALKESTVDGAARRLVAFPMGRNVADNMSVIVLRLPGGTGEIRKRLPVVAGVGGAAIVLVIAMAFLFLNGGTAKPIQQAPTPYPDTGQVPIEQATDLMVFAPGATTETKNAVIIPARYLLRNGASVAVLRVFDAYLYLGAQTVATLTQIQSADPGEKDHVIITVDQGQVLFRSGEKTFTYIKYTTRSNEGYGATVQAGSAGMLGVDATTGNITVDCIIGNCEVLAIAGGNNTLLVGPQRVTVSGGKATTPVALTESDSQRWRLLCRCGP